VLPRPTDSSIHPCAALARAGTRGVLPLGALAAGFGLLPLCVMAQNAPAAPAPAAETTLAPLAVKAPAETDDTSLRATTTTLGKGNQLLRDVPQSVTVMTQKLMEDRQQTTVKQALHNAAGITFLAAEGGEEDIRLRGFSLAASGDIYVDGLRDPAFYERDLFSFERVELLRGSASMLFGRGSTGGVVNQVSKLPLLTDVNTVALTLGSGNYARFTGDFNRKTGEAAALRINVTSTQGDQAGLKTDTQGIAPSFRWGIGTADEFTLGGYVLENDNGINYGLPWLQGGLIPVDPKNYYGNASDYNAGSAAWGTASHVHRFGDGAELKTTLRHGRYTRDQRSGALRFCVRSVNAVTGVVTNPDCPSATPTRDTLNASTPLTRGVNNKVQDMNTTYLQSDYSATLNGFGLKHEVLAGLDAAQEDFRNYNTVLPAGVVLNKNSPRTTIGTPNDGTAVDESLRQLVLNRSFDARALGLYAQNLVEVAPGWKLLAGLRWDTFKGRYFAPASTAANGTVTAAVTRQRSDSLWSKRFGVLYQPTDGASFHFSYGTSFNTSGDTYQYDDQSANTGPESSENLELGAKIDALDGRLSTRFAIFRSTKLNERNRDPDSAATQALLSGKRHSAGVEFDVAGRITPAWEVFASYAWVPVARIDVGAPGAVAGVGEGPGTRPSLTPRHSGSLWTTYQLLPALRLGGGLNARSSQTPNRNPVGIVAPKFVTADLMAEYSFSDSMQLKVNVNNVTNKLYADSLYSAHYVPGAPRTVQFTLSNKF